MKHIEQDGGGEGGGEHCETVVQAGDKYYKIVYSYYSYDGYNYDDADVYEVTPVQRLVTFMNNMNYTFEEAERELDNLVDVYCRS